MRGTRTSTADMEYMQIKVDTNNKDTSTLDISFVTVDLTEGSSLGVWRRVSAFTWIPSSSIHTDLKASFVVVVFAGAAGIVVFVVVEGTVVSVFAGVDAGSVAVVFVVVADVADVVVGVVVVVICCIPPVISNKPFPFSCTAVVLKTSSFTTSSIITSSLI